MDFSIIRKKIDQNKVLISPARRQVTYGTSMHSWEFFPTSWNATFVLLFLCFFGASQDVLRKYGHDWLCFNLIWFIAVASEKSPRWHLFKSDTLFLIDRCQKSNSASTTLGSSLTTRRRWSTSMCTWLFMEISICFLWRFAAIIGRQIDSSRRYLHLSAVVPSPVVFKDYSISELPGK